MELVKRNDILDLLVYRLGTDLKNWWESSSFSSLYLIGGFTTHEYNEFSDIDLLALTPDIKDNIPSIRNELKNLWGQAGGVKKIGIRVRTLDEINEFQYRMIHWGYNLRFAKYIYGTDMLPNFSDTKVAYRDLDILDYLIEKVWCDSLFLARDDFKSTKEKSLYIRSVLDVLNFNLILNGITLPTHAERVYKVKQSNDLSLFPYPWEILDQCLAYKMSGGTNLSIQYLNDIRLSYIKKTWNLVVDKYYQDNEEKGFDYWGMADRDVKKTKEYLKSLDCGNNYDGISEDLLIRLCFFNFALALDNLRRKVSTCEDYHLIDQFLNIIVNPILNRCGVSEFRFLNYSNLNHFLLSYEIARYASYGLAKRDWS